LAESGYPTDTADGTEASLPSHRPDFEERDGAADWLAAWSGTMRPSGSKAICFTAWIHVELPVRRIQ
jgi:hypothetical protein